MSLLSRPSLFAIVAVVDIAVNARGRRVNAKSMAKRLGSSARAFESMLQTLSRCGIVKSRRGPDGGYSLDRVGITVAQIVRAFDENGEAEAPDSNLIQNVVLLALASAELQFSDALSRITVEDLADRIRK